MTRVILAASSAAVRERLRTLVQSGRDDDEGRSSGKGARLQISGETSDAVRAHRLAARADVLVVSGASLLSQIADRLDRADDEAIESGSDRLDQENLDRDDLDPDDHVDPDIPLYAIVVITNDRRVTTMMESLPVRGWAVVTEDVARDGLMAAIAAADAGLGAMPVEWAARPHAIARARAIDWLHDDEMVADEHLTGREQEVLEWLSQGLSNRRIAERLGISEHTVKFHITAIYGKLGASTRTEAVNLALRRGWLRL